MTRFLSLPLWGKGRGECWRWPVTALATWLAAWALHLGLRSSLGFGSAVVAGAVAALAAHRLAATTWRRAIVALGFPLSVLAAGGASPWLWLLPLAVLALVYPLGAWRDAPLFPTPRGALAGLAEALPLTDGARILDAGCGTGDALLELASEYPRATLGGVERSAVVAAIARWRLGRRARVALGDLWRSDWSDVDLLYVFQRPESMARIAEKSVREMRPGATIVSLEFPIPGWQHVRTLANAKPLFVYRLDGTGRRERNRALNGARSRTPVGAADGRRGRRPAEV